MARGAPKEVRRTEPQEGETADRISVTLRPGDRERLERIAKETHLQKSDVIRRALATESFVQRTREEGRKILVQERDGTIREVEFIY